MSAENDAPRAVPKAVLDAVSKLVEVLAPLSSEDRQRAISAAMILFGPLGQTSPVYAAPCAPQVDADSAGDISPKATLWMKKYGIVRSQLDHVFSIEHDSIDIIAPKMPVSGKRQQTVQAYIICGLKAFIRTGEPAFTDTEGREACNKVGCYDVANHSNYRKAFSNYLNGSKESGWKLTNPGLDEAARIVKLLSPAESTI